MFLGGGALVEELLVAVPVSNGRPAPGQAPSPFLYPPYHGIAEQGSVFDHSNPNYTQTDRRIVAFSGAAAYKRCPWPAPEGTAPPGASCDAGDGGYWSHELGDWIYYDGHDGIDYGIAYRPVLAAADADQVVYAGWWDPQNHRANLGLYVQLRHPNGYTTTYGHLSAVAVQSCETPGCTRLARGEPVGLSGNTGNSIGPHLHFRLSDPYGRAVDPYGWSGEEPDPWSFNQSESLWVGYPALVYPRIALLPSGPPLDYPDTAPSGILVDDSSSRFTERPLSCWRPFSVLPGYAVNNAMRSAPVRTEEAECAGRWAFPPGSEPGSYALYIHIPSSHATSEGAVYTIRHAAGETSVVVNQVVLPNPYGTMDGWVYAGRYGFSGLGGEYVELSNRTLDEPARASGLEVGADAVRFVPVRATPASPTAVETAMQESPAPSTTPAAPASVPATQTTTPLPLPTATPEYVLVNVYFVDPYRLDRNLKPYEQAGLRWARSNRQARTVLEEYFRGPGDTEATQFGWVAVYSGFSGFTRFEVREGVAFVYLKGVCAPEGQGYTIADAVMVNLKQFDEIRYVKLFDQNGDTQDPDGRGDSIPACLAP